MLGLITFLISLFMAARAFLLSELAREAQKLISDVTPHDTIEDRDGELLSLAVSLVSGVLVGGIGQIGHLTLPTLLTAVGSAFIISYSVTLLIIFKRVTGSKKMDTQIDEAIKSFGGFHVFVPRGETRPRKESPPKAVVPSKRTLDVLPNFAQAPAERQKQLQAIRESRPTAWNEPALVLPSKSVEPTPAQRFDAAEKELQTLVLSTWLPEWGAQRATDKLAAAISKATALAPHADSSLSKTITAAKATLKNHAEHVGAQSSEDAKLMERTMKIRSDLSAAMPGWLGRLRDEWSDEATQKLEIAVQKAQQHVPQGDSETAALLMKAKETLMEKKGGIGWEAIQKEQAVEAELREAMPKLVDVWWNKQKTEKLAAAINKASALPIRNNSPMMKLVVEAKATLGQLVAEEAETAKKKNSKASGASTQASGDAALSGRGSARRGVGGSAAAGRASRASPRKLDELPARHRAAYLRSPEALPTPVPLPPPPRANTSRSQINAIKAVPLPPPRSPGHAKSLRSTSSESVRASPSLPLASPSEVEGPPPTSAFEPHTSIIKTSPPQQGLGAKPLHGVARLSRQEKERLAISRIALRAEQAKDAQERGAEAAESELRSLLSMAYTSGKFNLEAFEKAIEMAKRFATPSDSSLGTLLVEAQELLVFKHKQAASTSLAADRKARRDEAFLTAEEELRAAMPSPGQLDSNLLPSWMGGWGEQQNKKLADAVSRAISLKPVDSSTLGVLLEEAKVVLQEKQRVTRPAMQSSVQTSPMVPELSVDSPPKSLAHGHEGDCRRLKIGSARTGQMSTRSGRSTARSTSSLDSSRRTRTARESRRSFERAKAAPGHPSRRTTTAAGGVTVAAGGGRLLAHDPGSVHAIMPSGSVQSRVHHQDVMMTQML